jgi:hypothetical protein
LLLILASRHDRIAAALAERWAAHDARLFTADDLSVAGWRYQAGEPGGAAVIGGAVVPVGAIRAVLSRLSSVGKDELPGIVAADREYVGREMTAFLRAWLAALPCPVFNPPQPGSLGGPAWWPERWTHTAARLGIPVRNRHYRIVPGGELDGDTAPEEAWITVVGDGCIGQVADELAAYAQRLSVAARCPLLEVFFDGDDPGAAFVSANPRPSLVEVDAADAALALLLEATGC